LLVQSSSIEPKLLVFFRGFINLLPAAWFKTSGSFVRLVRESEANKAKPNLQDCPAEKAEIPFFKGLFLQVA